MNPDSSPKLVRAIGRWTLTALVINCIIGSGIFGLPDDVMRFVGTAAPWAYLLGALGTAILVASFTELASQYNEAGGPYVYARDAFGSFTGIQTAWFSWLARVASAAAVASIFVSYLGEFWADITLPLPRALLLIALIGTLTVINIRGVRQGAAVSNTFTIAKLVPLVLFVLVGFVLAPRVESVAPAVTPTAASWVDALLVLLFAFGGFESAFLAAGENKNSRRDAPFALLVAVLVITALYLSVHLVAMWSVPNLAASERPLADAARVFAGPVGAMAISVGAMLSTLGTLCAGVVTAPRLVYALGERGDFPRVFAAVHPQFRTPYIAILLWAALVLVLALWGNFLWNAVLSIAARLFTYGCTCAALIRMRKLRPDADAWRAPAGPLLALVGIAFCALLVLRLSATQALVIGGIAIVGTLNWLFVRARDRVVQPAAVT
jgi:amino acid transporter